MNDAPRVLVIGRIPAVNQRAVTELCEHGLAAVGVAGEGDFPDLDASGFAVVAIGGAIDPEARAGLKQRFHGQDPRTIVLDAYGPVVIPQVDAALRRAAGAATILSAVTVDADADGWQVRVTVDRACALRLAAHRFPASADITPLAAFDAAAGAHAFTVDRACAGAMLVVRADDDVEVRRLPGWP